MDNSMVSHFLIHGVINTMMILFSCCHYYLLF